MSKRTTQIIFLTCLFISLLLLLLIHGLALPAIVQDDGRLFIAETTLYLAGLGTLFFGWRLIDHKLPSKRRKDEH